MKISVVIPTYRRPEYLIKALTGLRLQSRPVDEVVLGLREGDEETAQFLDNGACDGLSVRRAKVAVPGVLASMEAASALASGDVVCFLDDDAEPRGDWLARIEAAFARDPALGALGGRDLLQDHPEMRRSERTTPRVGIFTLYGRILGNHHRGCGRPRSVHVLKGCNLAVRGEAFRACGLAMELRGRGAQPHWELALCLDIRNLGYQVVYDPALQVVHHVAPRFDADQLHRGGFSSGALHDLVWNEHHVVRTRTRGWTRFSHRLWALLVGSTTAPGVLQYVRLQLQRDPKAREKWSTTHSAMAAASGK